MVVEAPSVATQHCTDSYSTDTVQTARGSVTVGSSRRTCSQDTGPAVAVPRTVRRSRTVPTTVDVSRREIVFELVGVVTASRWGETVTQAFDLSHAPVSEAAYTARSETRAFSDLSLDALRSEGIARVSQLALSEPSRRLADRQADALEAIGYAAADDDTREESYLRSYYASESRRSRVIETYFSNHYGMDMAAVVQALAAR